MRMGKPFHCQTKRAELVRHALGPEVFRAQQDDLEQRLDALIGETRRLSDPDNARFAKRLSNLLRSARWSADLLAAFLWSAADARVRDLLCRNHEVLLLRDESVWERPESIALEGLGSVRSSKAARLKRIRKGYYSPRAGRPSSCPA